jgi:iron complex outermembrane receptor protein
VAGLGAEAAVAFTDRFIEDGSFIRLQNITVGYTLNTAHFKNLRLYVSADNLLTLTNYSGYDPEVSTISGLAEGIDYTNYPRARTFSFGINVGL